MKNEYGWVEELINYNLEYSIIICEAAICIKEGRHIIDKIVRKGGREFLLTRKITLDDFIESFCELDGVNKTFVRGIIEGYK